LKKIKKIGLDSEKRAAKLVKGELVRGSGCSIFNKGDYETQEIVYQNKFSSTGYKLTLKDLNKAKKDGLSKNKDYIFSVEFRGEFFYIFERILITEEKENKLKLRSKKFNKGLKLTKRILKDNLLLNDTYIVVGWDDFKNLGLISK